MCNRVKSWDIHFFVYKTVSNTYKSRDSIPSLQKYGFTFSFLSIFNIIQNAFFNLCPINIQGVTEELANFSWQY